MSVPEHEDPLDETCCILRIKLASAKPLHSGTYRDRGTSDGYIRKLSGLLRLLWYFDVMCKTTGNASLLDSGDTLVEYPSIFVAIEPVNLGCNFVIRSCAGNCGS